MLGMLQHPGAERRLVGEFPGVAVEIIAPPFGQRSANMLATGEVMPTVTTGQHRESVVTDARDRETIAGDAEDSLQARGGRPGRAFGGWSYRSPFDDIGANFIFRHLLEHGAGITVP